MKYLVIGGSILLIAFGVWYAFSFTCKDCVAAVSDYQSISDMKTKPLIVDVRTPAEYREGFMSDAINIPVEEIEAGKIGVISNIDKNAPIELYCRSGRRAEIAKEASNSMGYTNVVNLHRTEKGVSY